MSRDESYDGYPRERWVASEPTAARKKARSHAAPYAEAVPGAGGSGGREAREKPGRASSSALGLRNRLATILPHLVVVEATDTAAAWTDLLPEEMVIVLGAVDKRRREFAAGRRSARRALEKLGFGSRPLLAGETGEPLWPPGVIGSITHDAEYCVAAAAVCSHIQGIGIDLATSEPLSKELIDLVCTEREVGNILAVGEENFDADPYKMTFCVKEALYKCLFPSIRVLLDFQDVSVDLDSSMRIERVCLSNRRKVEQLPLRISGKCCEVGGYIFAGAWTERCDV